MDGLRQWALCLIIGGAAGTFAMAVSPRGSMDKTMRAVVGIFIVAVICTPLVQLKNADEFLPAFNDFDSDFDLDEDESLKEYMVSVCRDAVKKEIESAAGELGIQTVSAEIDMNIDDEYCIIIQEILIRTASDSQAEKDEFSAALQERLGVPVTIE